MDNDDVKIFTPEAAEPQHTEELDTLAAETEALRESGNLGAAKRLGREIAVLALQDPAQGSFSQAAGLTLSSAREQQLRVLMVFSGQHALRAILPQLLSEAAITAMNNYLINHSKPFWDTISDGSAFTQYLLAAPRSRKPASPEAAQALADDMGGVFAHLCGQEDNTDLCRLGAAVFTTLVQLVDSKWEAENA